MWALPLLLFSFCCWGFLGFAKLSDSSMAIEGASTGSFQSYDEILIASVRARYLGFPAFDEVLASYVALFVPLLHDWKSVTRSLI